MGCHKKQLASLHCQCHSRKRKCHCKKPVHCKVEKKLEKDCVRIDWTVPKGETQTIFQNGGFKHIFASGFVSYDKGDAPYVVVRFFLSGIQQGADIYVFEDSSVAFTYTKFTQVTVSCPSSFGNSQSHECEGQLSIHSRFPVH